MTRSSLFLSGLLLLGAAQHVSADGDRRVQIEELTRAIARQSTAELFLRRGELHRLEGSFAFALDDYQSAGRLEPSMDMIALCQARALFQAGHAAPAGIVLDEFLRRQPRHVAGYLLRAQVRTTLGKRQEAVADYDQAIAWATEPSPDSFLARALLQRQLGQPAAALQGLAVGVARLGPVPALHSAALEVELELGQFDSALQRIDALAVAADRKEHWLALRADILARAGRPSEAAASRQAALETVAALPPHLRTTPAMRALEASLRVALPSP